MRLHITLDDVLVGDLDRVVGARERSSFIATAVRRAIDELTRTAAGYGQVSSPQPGQRGLFLGRAEVGKATHGAESARRRNDSGT